MDKKYIIKQLVDAVKSGYFPHGDGEELFDFVLKRKCKIFGLKEPFRIFYPELGKTVKINSDVLYKRYVNLFQLLGVRKTHGKGTWVETYISDSKE